MIAKKICLLGTFAVGKTSLVARFVTSLFSEKYHTTVGVKIDKKTVRLPRGEVTLLIWDLAGEDEFQRVEEAYLRGASGYFLVADHTRRASLDQALLLQKRAQKVLGSAPFLLLINKCDLKDEGEIDPRVLAELSGNGWIVLPTSAKTGQDVETAFLRLTQAMMPE